MDERKTGSFHLTGAGQSGGVSAQPSDRELLMRAATAAGLTWSAKIQELRDEAGLIALWITTTGHVHTAWNPLDDDAPALRLAVRLNVFTRPEFWRFLALERFGGQEHDDCRAHRRAIVRAAAALTERSAEPTRAGTERHTRNEPDPAPESAGAQAAAR